jgi:hypothetical protein
MSSTKTSSRTADHVRSAVLSLSSLPLAVRSGHHIEVVANANYLSVDLVQTGNDEVLPLVSRLVVAEDAAETLTEMGIESGAVVARFDRDGRMI